MTQAPLPPPEPLDDAERKLARALRGLPGGSPPAELDALILAAARRAAQAPRARRERRWIIGLASAASAVLALGLLLRLHGPHRDAQAAAETAAPAASTIEPPPPPAPDARSSIETKKDSATAETAGGPANTPAATGNAAALSQPEEIMQPKPAPQAFPPPAKVVSQESPPPPPPPAVNAAPLPMMAAAPPPAPAEAAPALRENAQAQAAAAVETDAMARRDAQVRQESATAAAFGALSGAAPQEQAAKKSAPADALQANEPTAQRSLDKVDVTGARLKATARALPPLADDAKLDADAWIVRIRERLAAGEHDDAVSSLKSFIIAHPDAAIPEDLRPLLH